MDKSNLFHVTHGTKIVDFHEDKLSCIIDKESKNKDICSEFAGSGFEYNLKAAILKKHDGHGVGCRFIVKNDDHVLDYRCAPPNKWVTNLQRNKLLGIADQDDVVLMVCADVWTGDIEKALSEFYTG